MENANPSSTLGSLSQQPPTTTHTELTAMVNKLFKMRQTFDSLLSKTNNELTNQSSDSETFCPKERIEELKLRTKQRNNIEEEFMDIFPTKEELAYHKEAARYDSTRIASLPVIANHPTGIVQSLIDLSITSRPAQWMIKIWGLWGNIFREWVKMGVVGVVWIRIGMGIGWGVNGWGINDWDRLSVKVEIFMADLPLPDHVANLPEDDPVHPKPARIILHHAPAQPEGYVGDDDMEDDEEEDPDEDSEEEPIEQLEMEIDENDEENGGNDDEDDAEVINPYEEADPLNRPPPTSDEEFEFAPPVVPIVDGNDEPTEIRMAKKFKEDDLCMNRHKYDITALDVAVKENSSDYSKIMKFLEGLSRQFNELKEQCHQAERLSRWEAWVRKRIPEGLRFQEEPSEPPIHPAFTPCSDDTYAIVRDATVTARDDDGDDTTAPMDSQPFEPYGSPRDPQ
ncbi:hypothetical protein Tco_0040762 [Tanacetum coccineum]